VLGIDPGINGGIAIIERGALRGTPRILDARNIPTTGADAKRRVDAVTFRDWILKYKPEEAFVERAQAMPDQGSSSGFLYGRAVGYLEAIAQCCGCRLTIIETRAWKHHFKIFGSDKELSRQCALSLFMEAEPFMKWKKDHGIAEAVLIGLYGVKYIDARIT
jgi:hypothetical protein